MNLKHKRVSCALARLVFLWSVQCAIANVEYSGNIGGEPDFGDDGSFSWEELLKRSVAFQEMPSDGPQSTDSTRQFLAEFGATLDHCNKRIEEAAVVSEYMIKHFMATVVNRRPADGNDEEFLNRMIDENEIINENLDIPFDDIDVRLLNSDSNFWPSLLNVLGVLSEACDDLPVQIVETDIAARRETIRRQTVLDDIVSAMAKWTAQWSEKVKASASVFLNDCMAVENCETNLRLIMDVLGQSLEESLRSNSRVEALLRSYSEERKNAVHVEDSVVSHRETSVEERYLSNRGENNFEEFDTIHEGNTAGREKIVDGDGSRIDESEIISQDGENFILPEQAVHHSSDDEIAAHDNSSLENRSENSMADKLRLMLQNFANFIGFDSSDSKTTDSSNDEENIRENDAGLLERHDVTKLQAGEPEEKSNNQRSMGLLERVYHRGQINEDRRVNSDRTRVMIEGENQTPRFSHGGQRLLRLMSASLAVLQLPWQSRQQGKVVLELDGEKVVNTVPDEFLSFALESQLIQKPGEKFDTKSTKLRNLMQPLKTAVFRLGGSSANFLFYDPDDGQRALPEEVHQKTNPTNRDTWRSPFTAANTHGPWQPHQQHQGLSRFSKFNKRGHWQDNVEVNGVFMRLAPITVEENLVKTHPKLLHSKKSDWSQNSISPPMVHPKFQKLSQEHGVPAGLHNVDVGSHVASRTPRSVPSANDHHPKFYRRPWNMLHSPHDPRLVSSERETPSLHNFTLTASDFQSLLELCDALNWTLVFDVNQFTRDASGGWDSSNAQLLVAAAARAETSVVWQLGNEPNNYAHKFPFSINGTQMARDVLRLQRILDTVGSGTPGGVKLVGPDVTRPQFRASFDTLETCESERRAPPSTFSGGPHADPTLGTDSVQFLEDFLEEGHQLVDAISWHQYYVCGRTATVADFLSPATMELFPRQLEAIVRVRDQRSPGTPIWITETGSAYGGGAPGLSNRFAGTFLWLDKLGVAARGGVDVVARQSIFGGHYALLDQDYDPNPDYWVSVLHKQLVGSRVLQLTPLGAPATLRLYAHCMQPSHSLYQAGSVVVYGVNAGEEEAVIMVVGAPQDTPALEYVLTPALGDLTARAVLLNGVLLEVGADGEVPGLLPRETTASELRAPPHSVGFWVLQQSGVGACL